MEALQISTVASRHLASNSQSPCASRSLYYASNGGRKSASISSSWLGSSNFKSLSSRNLFTVRSVIKLLFITDFRVSLCLLPGNYNNFGEEFCVVLFPFFVLKGELKFCYYM